MSEWAFWRPFKAGKVTLEQYPTITYPLLEKINAILDQEEYYRLAEEGQRAIEEDKRKAKELATAPSKR